MVNVLFWFIVKPNSDSDSIRTIVTRYDPLVFNNQSYTQHVTYVQHDCRDHDHNDASHHSRRSWPFGSWWFFRWRMVLDFWRTLRFAWYWNGARSCKCAFRSATRF